MGEARRRAALACVPVVWACTFPAPGEPDPVLRELAEATAVRPFEGRLSLHVAHAPCAESNAPRCIPLPRPGTDDFTRLADASQRVLEASRFGTGGDARDEGLVELLWYDGGADEPLARAIERLEAAVRADSSAATLNDLAVAHLLRASGRGTPFDIVEALDLIERAMRMDSTSLSVRFNRALLLERFSLWGEVATAWEAYLALDARSPWANEARERLDGARARIAAAAIDPSQVVRAAVARADSADLVVTARAHAQAAREVGYDEVLPAWGRAWGSGDTTLAFASLRAARLLGAPLVDRSLADAVSLIEAGGDVHARAQAHRRYGDARELYDRGETAASLPVFEAVARSLKGSGDPLARWAETWAATSDFIVLNYEKAADRIRRAPAPFERPEWPALSARSNWLLGMVETRAGQPERALARLDRAARLFEKSEEIANTGFLLALSAEALRMLGRPEDSWRDLLRSLQRLSQGPNPYRLHGALVLAADGADRLGRHDAALALQTVGVRVAEPIYLAAEAFERRARMHARLGQIALARADLVDALDRLKSVPQVGNRRIGGASIQFTQAEMLLDADPLGSVALLDSVVAFDRDVHNGIRLAEALRLRAVARARTGDGTGAATDLGAALSEIERVAVGMKAGDDAASFGAAAQAVARELTRFHLSVQFQPIAALEAHESGRRLAWGVPRPVDAEEDLGRLTHALPEDMVVLKYAVLEDSVALWVLSRSGIDFHALASSRTLGRAARSFVAAITEDRTPEIGTNAEFLFSELIPRSTRPLLQGKRIVVVPDGFLGGVPFGALKDPSSGRWGAELWPITVAPDLDFLLASLRRPPGARPTTALLVGEPALDRTALPEFAPLPEARREIREIGDLYASPRILDGAQATARAVTEGLPGAGVLHFAGHAVYDPDVGGASRLVLSATDGSPADFVYTGEIAEWPLTDVRLVVLSACSSVTPSRSETGGLWGLAQPFLVAGASTVVGSLWEIGDESARALLTRFHRAWLDGADSGSALRQAQLALIRDPGGRFTAPRFWAAVQVVGYAP